MDLGFHGRNVSCYALRKGFRFAISAVLRLGAPQRRLAGEAARRLPPARKATIASKHLLFSALMDLGSEAALPRLARLADQARVQTC